MKGDVFKSFFIFASRFRVPNMKNRSYTLYRAANPGPSRSLLLSEQQVQNPGVTALVFEIKHNSRHPSASGHALASIIIALFFEKS